MDGECSSEPRAAELQDDVENASLVSRLPEDAAQV